ncbi:hypothetical protein QBC47DRAFT_27344 [Echria macrotheca]|uniref:Uncharacterized protein n=1 Tax=Echria macrotheca TaxID=438768 RepID=A0AAJ0BN57_9PEZI|nr:hypothetical protein QBC47DRAFT_27344 [Echria macrotheca]
MGCPAERQIAPDNLQQDCTSTYSYSPIHDPSRPDYIQEGALYQNRLYIPLSSSSTTQAHTLELQRDTKRGETKPNQPQPKHTKHTKQKLQDDQQEKTKHSSLIPDPKITRQKKGIRVKRKTQKNTMNASAANRTRGPSMATMDFTTKPLTLVFFVIIWVYEDDLCCCGWRAEG